MRWRLAAAALLVASCAHAEPLRPFSAQATMWTDAADARPFGPRPRDYRASWAWDAADHMVFRPLAELFLFEPDAEAINVNAMDEVPNSTWYQNRASVRRLSVDELVTGACAGVAPLDTDAPLTLVGAKPDGGNVGFMVEDAAGRRFLIKFDDSKQPERTTTAEVIGSMVYWAAGFHVPCNRIVEIDRDRLRIAEGVTVEVRLEEVLLDEERLDSLFESATPLPNGRFRASSSLLLSGDPLGPWRYEGVRDDDPNDVVPHEDRRELRGSYALAAWLLHFDSREQNTLAMWIDDDEDGEGFIRHHLIDFGDCLGSSWSIDALSRRNGYAAYFDVPQVLGDFFSLGAIDRPWYHVERGVAGQMLGYFDVEHFVPDEYRSGYRNPAFDRATERDLAWMARIIANITPAHIHAAVRASRLQEPVFEEELERVLVGRREKLLKRWLTRLSPLTWPSVVPGGDGGQALCLRDVAIEAGIAGPWDERRYWARMYGADGRGALEGLAATRLTRRGDSYVCASLPERDAAEAAPYLIVDIGALRSRRDRSSPPVRVHLRYTDAGIYRLAGLERPYDRQPPNR